MSTDTELDVRSLPHGRRHDLILTTYHELAVGNGFVLVNDHDPKPLYYQFEAAYPDQFTWDYLESGPEVWKVRIGRPNGGPTTTPVDEATTRPTALRELTIAPTGDLAQFKPDGPGTRALLASDRHKVILVALEDGQALPAHAPEVDLTFVVTDGTGEILTDTGVHPLHAGDVANVPAGGTRSVRARGGRLIAVAVASPPPTDADHAMPPKVTWPDTPAT